MKLLWPMTGQNIVRLDKIYIERAGEVRETHAETGRLQPHGDTQIKRNWLI